MALLRLHCFPSTSYISTEQRKQQLCIASPSALHKPRNQFIINNFPLSSQAHPFLIKRKKISHFVVHFSATTQNPAVDSSLNVSTKTTNTEEEEYSKTRVLAQNVPWNSTVEDIRSLFEKHGKVLDVEVFILHLLYIYVFGKLCCFSDIGFVFLCCPALVVLAFDA